MCFGFGVALTAPFPVISTKRKPSQKGCTLKDSFKLNRYSTYRQEKDEELVKFLVLFFLTSTASVDTTDIFSYEL